MKVYKEDFGVWKLNPVTQAFFQAIREMREEGLEELSHGVHSMDIGKTHLVIGKINALTHILNTRFGENSEETNDGRSQNEGDRSFYGS